MQVPTLIFVLFNWVLTLLQIPQDIPHSSDPVDFSSPINILFYIVLPIVMLVVFIMLRRRALRRREEDRKE
jgi:ABC-type glycerol-3-phosphate transport system permease component